MEILYLQIVSAGRSLPPVKLSATRAGMASRRIGTRILGLSCTGGNVERVSLLSQKRGLLS